MENVKVGLSAEVVERVTENNTAIKYGSGGVAVFATPAMIGLMENAALKAVDAVLSPGLATVGTNLEIKHLAATPIGMEVRARAELIEVDGKRLVFTVEAYDDIEKIGVGTHERFIINLEKFLSKTNQKVIR